MGHWMRRDQGGAWERNGIEEVIGDTMVEREDGIGTHLSPLQRRSVETLTDILVLL